MKKHNPPLLAVSNLNVSFRTSAGVVHAVRALDMELARGEVLAIVGESGSGKSVTARAILGLLPTNATVDYGAVTFDGERIDSFGVSRLRAYRGGSVAMIFQEPSSSFDPLYPIGKTLREVITAHSPDMPPDAVSRRSMQLLHEIGIEDAARRMRNYPHQFSGGQLQRIGLAVALAADPAVLIADEPTTALDVTVQAEIVALLKRIIADRSLSVVFISHDIALVASVADRIAVMYDGSIMEIGSCNDVVSTPHHPYTAALLKSVIRLGEHYRHDTLQTIPGPTPRPFATAAGCPFAERCEYVHDQCLAALPPLRAEATTHRCLISGEKKSARSRHD